MSKETLYLKIEENVQVHEEHVYLKDIAQLLCSNKEIENRVKALRWKQAVGNMPGRYPHSVMEVAETIQQEFPQVELNVLGGEDFIITLEKGKQPGEVIQWIKTAGVCILSFFGAAFSIMTFNNDVNVTKLFAQIYQLFTGQTSDGFTILELAYSVGIGTGIVIFFNHFAGHKLTKDPTPLEVQMRTYEDDVNKTVLEKSRHKPQKEKRMN